MKKLLLVLLVLLLSMLISCGNKKNESLTQEEITEKLMENGEGNNSSETIIADTSAKKVSIYTLNEETLETLSVETLIETSSELTMMDIVTAVQGELEDCDIEFGILDARLDGDKAIVDIEAANPSVPFEGVGAEVEGVVLDCISYSLFDNFDNVKAVYFLVNGEAYESGHISLAEDEPYITR